MARLELERVSRRYRSRLGDAAGVHDASLAVEAGEVVALCGASGSGKTTILNLLGLLDRADGGRYRLDGVDVTAVGAAAASRLRRTVFGFVFQSFQLLPALSARDNIALPLHYAGCARAVARARAEALLAAFELDDLAGRRPDELSGGQRQRVALCRSLANDPDILLADEPTGSLDAASAEVVVRLLFGLRRDHGKTLVLVTHDPALAARADRIVHVVDGVAR
jgi:putative ABC transport system ATP-binding protein